jgi:hypothetical protein
MNHRSIELTLHGRGLGIQVPKGSNLETRFSQLRSPNGSEIGARVFHLRGGQPLAETGVQLAGEDNAISTFSSKTGCLFDFAERGPFLFQSLPGEDGVILVNANLSHNVSGTTRGLSKSLIITERSPTTAAHLTATSALAKYYLKMLAVRQIIEKVAKGVVDTHETFGERLEKDGIEVRLGGVLLRIHPGGTGSQDVPFEMLSTPNISPFDPVSKEWPLISECRAAFLAPVSLSNMQLVSTEEAKRIIGLEDVRDGSRDLALSMLDFDFGRFLSMIAKWNYGSVLNGALKGVGMPASDWYGKGQQVDSLIRKFDESMAPIAQTYSDLLKMIRTGKSYLEELFKLSNKQR